MHPLTTAGALLIDRAWPGLDAFRGTRWTARYLDLMHEQFGTMTAWGALAPVLLFVGLPLVAAAFLMLLVEPLGALARAALGLAMVLLALGPRGGLRAVEAYPAALERDDEPAATASAREVIGAAPLPVPLERSRAFARAVPQAALRGAFGTATWALLAGPLGAIAWRVAERLESSPGLPADQHREARRLLAVLAWLPTRLLALTLAAMGRSEDALAEWRAHQAPEDLDLRDADSELLARVAHAALKVEPDEEDGGLHLAWCAVALAERAWLAWVAAMVVIGALGAVA
jgi:AmpE protein